MLASTSSQAQFFRELRSLLRAPYPLIHLKTYEEDRAVSLLDQLAAPDDRPVRQWSPIKGFGDGTGADPEDALAYVESTDAPAVFAFRGGAQLFDGALTRRRLRELADPASEGGKSMVVISPLPIEAPELTKDMATLAMPLPSREVLSRRCHDVFPDEDYSEIDHDRMVTGALGLTAR